MTERVEYNAATLQIAYDMGYQAFLDEQEADSNPFNWSVAPDLFNAWANGRADAYDDS
jgi:hypothetical protein